MNRRDFLTLMSSTAAMAILAPSCSTNALSSDRKTLVVIELAGGNDGLNTIIPYNDINYRKLRPSIAINDGMPISNKAAFHPALKDLKPIFDKGRVAIVQNVGYPNPNLSVLKKSGKALTLRDHQIRVGWQDILLMSKRKPQMPYFSVKNIR
jgi:uncharacterized protein (DUF1501 family)